MSRSVHPVPRLAANHSFQCDWGRGCVSCLFTVRVSLRGACVRVRVCGSSWMPN